MSNAQTTKSGSEKPVVAGSPQQISHKNKFSRAALLVAPFVAAFAVGFGISHALHSKDKSNERPNVGQSAKSVPVACSRDYAPYESGQYYYDEHGRLKEGYVVTDERGKAIICPPTWDRGQK